MTDIQHSAARQQLKWLMEENEEDTQFSKHRKTALQYITLAMSKYFVLTENTSHKTRIRGVAQGAIAITRKGNFITESEAEILLQILN